MSRLRLFSKEIKKVRGVGEPKEPKQNQCKGQKKS